MPLVEDPQGLAVPVGYRLEQLPIVPSVRPGIGRRSAHTSYVVSGDADGSSGPR